MKIVLFLIFVFGTVAAQDPFEKLKWIQGHWRSEFSGKVFWPTIPTMTYGEELIIQEAPFSRSAGVKFYNFSARAWSHSTKDQLHDEWGYLTINDQGNVTLMTTGNNGFTTYEEGYIDGQKMVLRLKKIGRISFSRDLPVEDLERKFTRLDNNYLEQTLRMRTATHPKIGLLDHAVIVYELKKPKVPGAPSNPPPPIPQVPANAAAVQPAGASSNPPPPPPPGSVPPQPSGAPPASEAPTTSATASQAPVNVSSTSAAPETTKKST